MSTAEKEPLAVELTGKNPPASAVNTVADMLNIDFTNPNLFRNVVGTQ